MVAHDIIVIGASAGGFDAIQTLVSMLPPNLEAAVFVTIHLAERSVGLLPELLNRVGPLPAIHPWEETPIEMGRIYVAPPDYHLILTPETVHVGHGPRENLQRPCINTMFRSAAAAHGSRVSGVLLTGLLDDGAAGLWEIQQKGGVAIVQDPDEAAFRSMPESAIRGLNVQYIVRVAEVAPLLVRLTMGEKTRSTEQPSIGRMPGQLAMQSCPECGGAMTLYSMDHLKEYRCHIGHRFGLKTMIAEKRGVVERALSSALSQSEELSALLKQAGKDTEDESIVETSKEIDQRKEEQELLRHLLNRSMAPSLR